MPEPRMAVVLASAARTANGTEEFGGDGAGSFKTIRAQVEVTAASGTTPSLAVVLEDTLDGTNWNAIGTFTALTAAGRQVIDVTTPFAERLRARWTITGTTPSFTFSLRAFLDTV